MVNSKKINKSTVAIVVLSLLLVLSLVLTATGAWFTDHNTGTSDKTATFGKIQLNATTLDAEIKNINGVDLSEGEKVMPGDIITLTGTVSLANDSEKAYVFIAVPSVANYKLTTTGWTALQDHAGVYYATFEASNSKTLTLVYDTKDVTEDYSNSMADNSALEYMTQSVLESVSFKVAAVQFKNVADENAAYAIVADSLSLAA